MKCPHCGREIFPEDDVQGQVSPEYVISLFTTVDRRITPWLAKAIAQILNEGSTNPASDLRKQMSKLSLFNNHELSVGITALNKSGTGGVHYLLGILKRKRLNQRLETKRLIKIPRDI